MTRVWLVRHGESMLNVTERLQGWSDAPLTARGHSQASARAEDFVRHGVSFDAVVSADGIRHRATARTLAPHLTLVEDAGWREVCFGDLEAARGRRLAKVFKRYRDVDSPMWAVLVEISERNGAEHPETVVARATDALDRAAALGDDVLVVSSGITKMLLLAALGADLAHTAGPANLAVSTIEGAPGAWRVTRAVDLPPLGAVLDH